jgi:hypothetical protein
VQNDYLVKMPTIPWSKNQETSTFYVSIIFDTCTESTTGFIRPAHNTS